MMTKMLLTSGLLLILSICSQMTPVHSVDGRLFFLAYMNLTSTSSQPANGFQEIFISGFQTGNVTISYLPLGYVETVNLNSTNSYRYRKVIYPDLGGALGTELPASVIIASQVNISVQTNKAESQTSGGYLALPITTDATLFYLASYTPRNRSSMVTIAAPYDTCVDIHYQNGPTDYRMLNFDLAPGTQYTLSMTTQDLTGVYITTTKPVAVYSGLDCAYVPYDESVNSCDHIIEQMPPVAQYGNYFIMATFYGRNPAAGYQYRVIATTYTTVTIQTMTFGTSSFQLTGTLPIQTQTVYRGQFYEGTAGRGVTDNTVVMITCDNSCLVMQYNPAYDATPGKETTLEDEFMVTVAPTSAYTNQITFDTSDYYMSQGNTTYPFVNGMTLVAHKSDLSSIMLDGTPVLQSAAFKGEMDASFPSSMVTAGAPSNQFSILTFNLPAGWHTITAASGSTALYTAFVYGSGSASTPQAGNVGYGYLAGMQFTNTYGTLVTAGPWFDPNYPQSINLIAGPTVSTTPAPAGVPAAQYPAFTSVWVGKFYTLVPVYTADLKTKNCSEAYYRFYMAKRFNPMHDYLTNVYVPANCSGVTINMTNVLYYSEYTDGLIEFSISMTAMGSATMSDIVNCQMNVAEYVSQYGNWGPPGDVVLITDFLKNQGPYTIGCDILHMKYPEFLNVASGWGCPMSTGLGLNTATSLVSPSLTRLLCWSLSALLIVLTTHLHI